MTAALQQLVALQSRVWDFLSGVSPDQLAELADGTLTLALAPVGGRTLEPVPVPAPAALTAVAEPRPPTRTRSTRARQPAKPPLDPAEAAVKLRAMDSVDDGAAYLAGFKLLKKDLLAVGRELGLPIPSSRSLDDIVKLVLNQAIGARRKFEGLSKW